MAKKPHKKTTKKHHKNHKPTTVKRKTTKNKATRTTTKTILPTITTTTTPTILPTTNLTITTTPCPPYSCPNLKQWDPSACACVCPSLPAEQLCVGYDGVCSIDADCKCECSTTEAVT